MATAEEDMNRPSWWQNNLTLGNALTFIGMLLAGAYGYGQLGERIDGQVSQLRSRIENIEQFRVERVRQTDAKFSDMASTLQALPNLAYRVTANEEAVKSMNARFDQSLANISARLAEINQALGALDTKVAVLTQRIEMQRPERRAGIAPTR